MQPDYLLAIKQRREIQAQSKGVDKKMYREKSVPLEGRPGGLLLVGV